MKKQITIVIIALFLPVVVLAIGQINIAKVPFTISIPGSYILVKDLTLSSDTQSAISITTSNVTLDLNGHTLYGLGTSSGSGDGISANGNSIVVFNGAVTNFPGYGVYLGGSDQQVYNMRITKNKYNGIAVGNNCIIRDNVVEGNNSSGIGISSYCVVRNNAINANSGNGINGGNAGNIIENNTIHNNGRVGISSNFNCRISGNVLYQNKSTGIVSGVGAIVTNNSLNDNVGGGISVSYNCVVDGNQLYYNGATTKQDGIYSDYGGTITNNSITVSGGWGINAGPYSIIQNNSAYSNTSGGIYTYSGSLISKNTLNLNGGDGIRTGWTCKITDNNCDNNGYGSSTGYGIHVLGVYNTIENNSLTQNDRGLSIDTVGNYFAGNRWRGNTVNLSTTAGNTGGDGNHGFQNITFYNQSNYLIQSFAGFNIPMSHESPQGVLRTLRW